MEDLSWPGLKWISFDASPSGRGIGHIESCMDCGYHTGLREFSQLIKVSYSRRVVKQTRRGSTYNVKRVVRLHRPVCALIVFFLNCRICLDT